jgi:hypothetical protein
MENRIVACIAFGFLAACAGLPVDDTRHLAEVDHQACDARGLSFPSRGYERCRYDLADRRHEKDWRNLQLAQFPRIDQDPVQRRDDYRPLPRTAFRCMERFEDGGGRWVDCGGGR